MVVRQAACLLLGVFVCLAGPAVAQEAVDPADRQAQLREAEQIQRQREQDKQAPFAGPRDARAPQRGPETALPEEALCFPIRRVRLSGGGRDAARFSWLWQELRRYEGRCIGREGIDLIRRRALDRLVARGLVTSRIGVPQQDLSRGELRFELLPGRLREVRVVGDGRRTSWRAALPLRPGDVVDLRAIEQGVEQFKRLPSQDARIDIAPGEQPGESDLIVNLQHTRRWRVVGNADDAGVEATGRYQGGVDVTVDGPLGLNDLLGVGYSHDLSTRDRDRGTRGRNLSYSLPWGWWTFSLSASEYRYRQRVEGFRQSFHSSGLSRSGQLDLQRVLRRGARSKTALGLTLGKRRANSYLDGIEIGIQRRNTTSAELYLTHRQYLGAMQLDLRLAHRRGVPWFDGQWIGYDPAIGFPGYRYGLTTLDLSGALPFRWGGLNLSWESSLRAQAASQALLGSEFITLGGRYSVRGFDGESALGAERGAYWRNTLNLALHPLASPYLGLDAGVIGGPSAGSSPGRSLVGGVVGLRGAWRGLNWDGFAGWAIHRPEGLETARPTYGARLIYAF